MRKNITLDRIKKKLKGLKRGYINRASWNNLRDIGNSNLVKISMFSPVAAYIINSNSAYLNSAKGPASCFFVGTLLLGLASFLFRMICPAPSRKYDTAIDYTNAEAEFFTANPFILRKMLRTNVLYMKWSRAVLTRKRRDWAAAFARINRINNARDDKKDAVCYLMDELWHVQIARCSSCRLFIRVLFDVGFGLIFIYPVYNLSITIPAILSWLGLMS